MPQLTWFITGCSSGFGEHLTLIALSRGDKVIAATRGLPTRLSALQEAGATTISLDVCASQETLDTTISEALNVYGGIDVLVNNAGYIEAGLLEDLSHERMLDSFNTNLFGAINLTRSLLPHFREKKSGTVVFMGSIGGWQGEVGAAPYCATKFAMEGVAECLKKETEPFGIRTLIFEPAHYRTKVFSPTNYKLQPLRPGLEAYQEIHDVMVNSTKAFDGNQPGDPEKGMNLIVDVVRKEGCAVGKDVPIRMPLGKVGIEQLRNKCEATLKMLDEWEREILEHDE